MRFWRGKRREQELDDEISAHLQMALQDRLERGQSLEEAKAAVRAEFGNVGLVKEVTRNITGSAAWESVGKDLRYACRTLIKNLGFSMVSILALALGIGANAAVYGVVHSVLLTPLPFPHSERLVRLWDSFGTPGNYAPVSYPNFRDWRAWNHSFTDMAAYSGASYTLTGSGEAAHLEGVICSASFFSILQAQPILGRTFLPEEDRPGANSILLSYQVWKERFGQSPSILGHTVFLDRKPFTVIGIMPRGFNAYTGGDHSDFWITTAVLTEPSSGSAKPVSEERGMSFLNVVARLKPGIPLQQA